MKFQNSNYQLLNPLRGIARRRRLDLIRPNGTGFYQTSTPEVPRAGAKMRLLRRSLLRLIRDRSTD